LWACAQAPRPARGLALRQVLRRLAVRGRGGALLQGWGDGWLRGVWLLRRRHKGVLGAASTGADFPLTWSDMVLMLDLFYCK
jgi:hypothetical protein